MGRFFHMQAAIVPQVASLKDDLIALDRFLNLCEKRRCVLPLLRKAPWRIPDGVDQLRKEGLIRELKDNVALCTDGMFQQWQAELGFLWTEESPRVEDDDSSEGEEPVPLGC